MRISSNQRVRTFLALDIFIHCAIARLLKEPVYYTLFLPKVKSFGAIKNNLEVGRPAGERVKRSTGWQLASSLRGMWLDAVVSSFGVAVVGMEIKLVQQRVCVCVARGAVFLREWRDSGEQVF